MTFKWQFETGRDDDAFETLQEANVVRNKLNFYCAQSSLKAIHQ
jgi:hypothetical protein